MSINALTNAAVARRTDFFPQTGAPRGLGEIAKAGSSIPVALPEAGVPTPSSAPLAPTPTSDAINSGMHVLFGYIPTEVLTLYVAVLGAIQKPSTGVASAEWAAFWIFFAFTPVVVWMVNGIKVKAAQKALPLAFRTWPLWEMFAATFAYSVWTLALPGTPFAEFTWYSSSVAGIVVLVASTALGLLGQFFQKPITP